MLATILLPERDCATCTGPQKKQWGCNGGATLSLEFDGEVQDTCPRRPFFDNPQFYNDLFFLYTNYQRGILPEEGSLLSQPHRALVLLRKMEGAQAAAQDEQQKQEQKQAANRQRMQAMMQGKS